MDDYREEIEKKIVNKFVDIVEKIEKGVPKKELEKDIEQLKYYISKHPIIQWLEIRRGKEAAEKEVKRWTEELLKAASYRKLSEVI